MTDTNLHSMTGLLARVDRIYGAAAATDDGRRCMVAPHPDLKAKLEAALSALRLHAGSGVVANLLSLRQRRLPGQDDGVIVPPGRAGLSASPRESRAARAAPLRGTVRVIVVLVDFSDKAMTATKAHFEDLFFSIGKLPRGSVREYYREVTNGAVDIDGAVVGTYRLPKKLTEYANGASGMGAPTPNARTMARDALDKANADVDFGPYDNDGNGYVDAFIVIHAGAAAEVTGSADDIWSHKWVVGGAPVPVDATQVYGYLTVPEDCNIGVCCHELGHLLFGWPDLYDTDQSSEGLGNWCLMAAGSWGGTNGDRPVHPSAWCKVDQGWVQAEVRTTNASLAIADVKASQRVLRLWKDGALGVEYFLVENRQLTGFDASLPSGGLLVWHVDEGVASNTDENHYRIALVQADARRDLEANRNRGDAGDPYPGSAGNTAFDATSTPNSNGYSGAPSCVAVRSISAPAASMSAYVAVSCTPNPVDETKWITALYADLLGRAPDAGGLAYWVTRRNQGASLDEISNGFLNSEEYCGATVRGLYRTFLQREGEPAGVQGWMTALEQAAPLQQLVTGFCDSVEYKMRNPPPEHFVESLYVNLLGRASDPGGKQYWVGTLQTGATTGSVIDGFLRSQEYATLLATGLYQNLLGRQPETAGLAGWVQALTLGTPYQQIQRGFVCSDEYRARAVSRL